MFYLIKNVGFACFCQVEQTKYVFEAKTIQRMELLLLSTLKWKMHPVTPLSFLDHITRRLGLKSQIHWEFYRKCEQLLLCFVAGESMIHFLCHQNHRSQDTLLFLTCFDYYLISDSRFVDHLPSVLATATMMHVINQVEPSNAIAYQNQLLSVLKLSKVCANKSSLSLSLR